EIPAFVLQTFVENCIKHGIAKILHPGHVSIKSYREENFLVCEVEDNGPGIDLDRIYKSTGLSNTIRRFENLYQTKNLLHFENTGNGTLVKFKVPVVLVPNLSGD
ncbi:MAG: ATP-binding protein, partial [Bacteroidota bacterium]